MNTWIFQGNPNRFKVDDYLLDNQDIVWGMRQEYYLGVIQKGDTVFIWRSDAGKKGSGGIVAKTVVTGMPLVCKIPSAYWADEAYANEEMPRIPLHIEGIALDGNHINREFLKNSEILSDLLILKMSNATNFLISSVQAKELLRLWEDGQPKLQSYKYEIPLPDPVPRNREFLSYSEELRSKVLYEYLFSGNSHRWIDEHTLELDSEWSRGYQAMGILHHLGLKNAYKGIFKGLLVAEAVDLIEQECVEHPTDRTLYEPIISSLSGIGIKEQQDEVSEGDVQTDEGKEYPEGKIAFVLHKKRERNPRLIKEAKELFISKHGRLYCEACNFDFQKTYGDRGIDFMEGHHKKLVSEMEEGEKTRVEDIAMLCSNCHRMIHRKPLISVEQLAQIINTIC